ncbi:MAG: hypothetical protein JSV56_06490 [Methanomassiliicoccales archaeon]|nr:MAG: hypothetical protein JSV56_06490 [Methanomassiliicoccales archaeon]
MRGEGNSFHTYDEMVAEIMDIEAGNSSIVKVHNLTTTFEGRTLWAVKISDDPKNDDPTEPDVLITGGQKANSLVSVEIAMYLLNYLTNNYGTDNTVTEIVDNREIWILPMLNPDGHEYVENDTMNWEKNRVDNQDSTFGVNLDRNYGFNWGTDEHTSDNPPSQYYHGNSPFSEQETKAVRNLVESHDFVFSLSFSSYGEFITYPWGYTNSSTPDDELLIEIAKDMAMYSDYTVKQSGKIYVTHGNTDDWLYNEAGILPFTVLAGSEDIPQEGEIEAICEENLHASLYLMDIADDPSRAKKAQWTFMVYMSADDTLLEEWGIADFNEMETIGSNPYVNIVAQFDRAAGGDSSNGDWKDTRRFLVMRDYDTQLISTPMLSTIGEANMADPQTLLDFVNWSITNYPADHFLLDLWGHGRGWQGVTLDQGDWLSMSEIKSVLPKFKDRIDVVGFDNCNMAMIEVYTQFMGFADYIVGSEKEEDALGWPYEMIFEELAADSQMSPLELSTLIATQYVDWAENESFYSATVSVADLSHLQELINKTDALAKELNRTLALYLEDIRFAMDHTEQYAKKPYPRDLYHFAELLEKKVPNTPIKIAAENVMRAVSSLILVNEHWTSPWDSVPVDFAHGIAVWLYDGSESDYLAYKNLDYATLTHWDEFLGAYKSSPPKPRVFFEMDYALTDSDGEGNTDSIELKYKTNISGLNVAVEVFNSENQHIITFYTNDTENGVEYDKSFNPYDHGYPADYYNFFVYLANDANETQSYSEATSIWLGNERPDVVLKNVTFCRKDGSAVGGNTGKRPIEGENTQIKAYIANNGTVALSDISIEFFEEDNLIHSENINLHIGDERIVTTNWPSQAGKKSIRTVVDRENSIKEVNESNNEYIEIVEVKSNIPVDPLTVRGKVFNKDNINIIGAKVQIRNLRTNETINKTTTEKGYSADLETNWYLEGDPIDVEAEYNSVSDNISFFAYSEDEETYVNITLDTDVYDILFYFKLALIGFEIVGFFLVVKYYLSTRRGKRKA